MSIIDFLTLPFTLPNNYREMLVKIAIFSFFAALLCIIIIGCYDNSIAAIQTKFEESNILSKGAIPVFYLLVAFAFAISARAIRLHDKISNVYFLRKFFDVNEILMMEAGAVGIAVDIGKKDILLNNRDDLMVNVFYEYATGTRPKIDRQYVAMALDNWCWFWIILESAVAFIISGLYCFIKGICGYALYEPAAIFFLIAIFLISIFGFVVRGTRRRAHVQVKLILRNAEWRANIKEVFDEVLNK